MYSETLPWDFLSIRIILRFAQVKPHVETKLGRQIDHFDPKSYKSQVPTYLVYPNKTEWASEASSLRFERGRKNGV